MKKERIPGGKSKGMSLRDIAIMHCKSDSDDGKVEKMLEHLKLEFKKGIKTELEHTTDKNIAREIAMDHLYEDPKYYTKLSKIEEGDLVKTIRKTIRQYLNENTNYYGDVKNTLIKRIPFLKEYNIYEHPRDKSRLEAQKISYHSNIKVIMGDDILTFPQFNVSSEVIYYPHKIDDNTFHHFIIKNEFHATTPKEWDDLTRRVFFYVNNSLGKKLSYNREYMVKNDEEIPSDVLDEIINDMNRTLFEIEEFTSKKNIDLF